MAGGSRVLPSAVRRLRANFFGPPELTCGGSQRLHGVSARAARSRPVRGVSDMRLWLSDKAAKAMKDLPAAMNKAATDGQPKAGEASPESKDDKRAKEDEAREAKKEAKKELK